MVLNDIGQFLQTISGLDPDLVGRDTIERLVNLRMSSTGCDSFSKYWKLLSGSPDEQQALINEITVPETWFFRDHEPFKYLAEYVDLQWEPSFGQRLNVLSIPCSTGEEPYSISITLLELGLGKNDFSVDAVDISSCSLEKAKIGLYGENSFRSVHDDYKYKYFDKEGKRYKLHDVVKEPVSFYNENILSENLLCMRGPYDVVFCRNLLIYFSKNNKKRVIEILRRLLVENGILFLGHAETGIMEDEGFDLVKRPGTFAFKHLSNKSVQPVVRPFIRRIETPSKQSSVEVPKHEKKVTPITSFPKREPSSDIDLNQVRALADKGHLNNALSKCERFIEAFPESVEGSCLLGVIHLALDNDGEAERYFKHAISLNPKHYESLVHLAILAEEKGDASSADKYRERFEKLSELKDE